MSNVIDIGALELSVKDGEVVIFDSNVWAGIQFDVSEWESVKGIIDKLIVDNNGDDMKTIERIKSELVAVKDEYELQYSKGDYASTDYYAGKVDGIYKAISVIDNIVNECE